MRFQKLDAGQDVTYALIFDKGNDVISGLTNWAKNHEVKSAHFTAIGAFDRATLGYFDRQKKDYERIEVREQVEVLTLTGDIALEGDEPKVHAHVVVGRRGGHTLGGHLLRGNVWPTLEVMLVVTPANLQKRFDPETGLALIWAAESGDVE